MIPVWKKIPFLRLLPQLAAGILSGWYFQLHWHITLYFVVACLLILFYSLFSIVKKFFTGWVWGIASSLFCFSLGISLVEVKQLYFQNSWAGYHYRPHDPVQLRLLEPLTEKEKSFKATAAFEKIIHDGKARTVTGKLILYFKKDSTAPPLNYGSIIVTNRIIPEIKNTGNPGGFDYKRYALFNGITHQVFLQKGDYVILPYTKQAVFHKWIFTVKTYVLSVLRRYLRDTSSISVAEALLIGYRDDLDVDLVQAYSNTGVVHVIAISGLHLGIIYWMLILILKPLDKKQQFRWLKPLVAVSLLWIFSLLTGAGASVVRAAIMFTFIAVGDLLKRKGNIYNSMAASAFIMLLWKPFLLWDVGFQLSYAAVLSIVLFMKPIYHCLNVQYKIIDKAWQLTSVTLSAQTLTLPLYMYHFHQVPNLFLITNFVAVPLSSCILFGEIFLIAVSFMPTTASAVGLLLNRLLNWMNGFISWVNKFSFAVTDGIRHSPIQTILLYCFITGVAGWLLHKNKKAFQWSFLFLAFFFTVQTINVYHASTQKKLIVYNISKYAAADIIVGKRYLFAGDSLLLQDGFMQNFHLKPSRILYGTYRHALLHHGLQQNVITINGKRIVFINRNYRFRQLHEKIKADILIVSKNPRLYIDELIKTVTPGIIIFDSSNPQWKINYWKKDCERLHINCFSTSEQGAFVMNL